MLNKKQRRFCVEFNSGKTAIESYKIAYGTIKTTTANSCARHLLMNPNIIKELERLKGNSKEIRDKAIEKASEELKEEIVKEFLCVQQKRKILFDIATGAKMTKEYDLRYNGTSGQWDTIPTRVVEPSFTDIINAIKADSALIGDNAPTKQENRQVDEKGETVPLEGVTIVFK